MTTYTCNATFEYVLYLRVEADNKEEAIKEAEKMANALDLKRGTMKGKWYVNKWL